MEPFWDDENEEEMERRIQEAKRKERIRRQRKQARLKRRRRKKMMVIGGLAAIILIIIAIITALFGNRQQENKENQDTEQEVSGNLLMESEDQELENSVDENTDAESNADEEKSEEEIVIESILKSAPSVQTASVGKSSVTLYNAVEEMTFPYRFTETKDTVAISGSEMTSSNAILVNADTDVIVASKGAKERISPASMTKVLTVLVAAEHITEQQLDDNFTITLEITDYAYSNDCSAAGFLDEEVVTVRDLFYGTILPSGGDAALGLAMYVAGSHEAFVEMMNEKLEELGISDSAHFTNCVGLYDEKHYCTVYDMAVIMKAAMENELCREVLTTRTYTTTKTAQHTEGITISNWFIRRIEDKETDGAVIGAKTGYVVESQNCAVSYGEMTGGTPYICVTAGASSGWRCIYDHVEIYTEYVK